MPPQPTTALVAERGVTNVGALVIVETTRAFRTHSGHAPAAGRIRRRLNVEYMQAAA